MDDHLKINGLDRLILLLLFFAFGTICKGQKLLFNIQFYNQEDGLSDRSVFCVGQDDRGIIWIGTGNGLNMYDGKQFRKVKNKDLGITSGNIIKLQKQDKGSFWIQKENEPVAIFDPLSEHAFPLGDSTLRSKRLEIIRNVELKDGCLARDNQQQLYMLNKGGQISPMGTLKHKKSTGLIAAGNESILIGGDKGGVVEINFSGDTIYQNYELHWNTRIMQPNGVEVVFSAVKNFEKKERDSRYFNEVFFKKINNNDRIPQGLYRSGRPLKLGDVVFEYSHFIRLVKDFKERIWLVSQDHVMLFDKKGNFLKDISPEISRFNNVTWTANDLFIDRDNRLWIASGLGVFVIEVKADPFQKYQQVHEDWSTRCIFELPDEQLFVSTYHGARLIDKASGTVKDSFSDFGLSSTTIHPDTILIGTHGPLLHKYLPGPNKLISSPVKVEGAQRVSARIPFYDKISGRLLLGTSEGLCVNLIINDYTRFRKITSDTFPEFDYLPVKCFYQNMDGLYIGTNKGLYLYKEDTGITAHYTFPFNDIKHVHEDSQGDFWIATNGGGLIHWNRKSDLKKQYTTEDGLSHDVIYAVYEDALGFLWLPSNNGLMRFDKQSEETIVFLPEDGITNKEFNTYSHYQAPDGRLYFGGLDGVIAFDPEDVKIKKSNAPLVWTKFQVYDGDADRLIDRTEAVRTASKIMMKPDDKFFILDFAWLDYSSPEKNFAWRLNEESWNYQKENTIRINKLPYGSHQLEVKAKSAGGQWAAQQIVLPIVVATPFYMQTPFILLTILALGLMIWGVIIIRTTNLKRQAEALSLEVFQRTQTIRVQKNKLEEASQFKDKILTLVAHDLRSPLLTLSGLAQKINFLIEKDRVQEVKKLSTTVENSVEGATKLLDDIMNWALLQRGEVKMLPEAVPVKNAVQEVVSLYQNAAAQKQISIDKPDNDLSVFVDPTALQTILRNLLHNAIKFTPRNGHISFHADKIEKQIRIEVKDNGIGIPPDRLDSIFTLDRKAKTNGTQGEKGTGIGLSLCKELIDRNQGTIRVESAPGRGTTFICLLPAI